MRELGERGHRWLLAAGAVVVAVVLLLLANPALYERLSQAAALLADPDTLAARYRELGAWAVAISTGLLILETVVAPLPGWPVVMANGVVFGLFAGVALSLAGAWLGAMLTFTIGRRYGQEWLFARLKPDQSRLIHRLSRRDGFAALVLLRLIPVTSLDIIGYLAGMSTVRPGVYALATAVGLLPGVVGYTVVGLALAELGVVTGLLTAAGLILLALYLSYRFGPAIQARMLGPDRGGQAGR